MYSAVKSVSQGQRHNITERKHVSPLHAACILFYTVIYTPGARTPLRRLIAIVTKITRLTVPRSRPRVTQVQGEAVWAFLRRIRGKFSLPRPPSNLPEWEIYERLP